MERLAVDCISAPSLALRGACVVVVVDRNSASIAPGLKNRGLRSTRRRAAAHCVFSQIRADVSKHFLAGGDFAGRPAFRDDGRSRSRAPGLNAAYLPAKNGLDFSARIDVAKNVLDMRAEWGVGSGEWGMGNGEWGISVPLDGLMLKSEV
jgi:hypothetical protein